MDQASSRKLYIDNLRSFSLLLVFTFHVLIIYNNWGERFYVNGQPILVTSLIGTFLAAWLMPLLFTIAGMSARYAIRQRNAFEYVKERVNKLFIPLVFGLLLVIPVQSYLASLFHFGSANYLDYFTQVTDLSGTDGAFTPGQLWFLLYLFVISMVSLPFMYLYKEYGKGTFGDNLPLAVVVLLGLLPCIGSLFDIAGKSPTEYLAYFLFGYFCLTSEVLLAKLEKYSLVLFGSAIAYACVTELVLNGETRQMVFWLTVLAIIGFGRRFLEFTNKFTVYLAKSSFGVYIFHQSWIVVVAYFVFLATDSPWLQMPLIYVIALALTYLTYELSRRIPLTRWMFGFKR